MNNPFIITVVLNFGRPADTLSCVASLHKNNYGNHRIIVLDTPFMDGAEIDIPDRFPEASVIQLTENRGYAGNNNVGITAAIDQGADWVFVLNEDTILAPDCLSQMIAAAQERRRVGIVGPMVYHHDEPHIIQSAGGRLDRYWAPHHIAQNEHDHGQLNHPHDVDWISGCAILVRRQVIEQVSVLDERFFCYREETEWCLRASRAGWTILHVPAAKLWHKGVRRDYQPDPYVTYYNTRNRFLLLAKHRAPLLPWLAAWADTARTLISWSLKPRWQHMRDHRNAMWQGALDFLRRRWGIRPV